MKSRNLDIRKNKGDTVPNKDNEIGKNVYLFIRKVTELKQIKPKFQYNVKSDLNPYFCCTEKTGIIILQKMSLTQSGILVIFLSI